MPFTDQCDLFAAVHEQGVNRVIHHFMRQRPSLFNYATADIAANRELWCSAVVATPDVGKHGNPLFTILPPLPLLGADSPSVGVGFCAQVTAVKVDFFPSDAIELPAALKPPLETQRLALHLGVCGGIECPADRELEQIPFASAPVFDRRDRQSPGQPVVLRGRPSCFCLDVLAVGHVELRLVDGKDSLLGRVDSLDIVEIEPAALESNLACYLKTALNAVLREKLTVAFETLMLSFPLFGFATVTVSATANPPVPHNPAIEDDRLKAFATLSVN